jgi:hypothetical protein
MVLPYNLKNQVTSQLLHELIINYRKDKSKPNEEKLFCAFWEISKIIRAYVSVRGYKNLNNEDWLDIQITCITHMFNKLKHYNGNKKRVCFAFCYMILYNKIRDLVKSHSFTKYVYHGLTDINSKNYLTNLSTNHKGYYHQNTNIKPIKRFNSHGK